MAVVEHILNIRDEQASRQLGDLADKTKRAADGMDDAGESAEHLADDLKDVGPPAAAAGDDIKKVGDAAKHLEDRAGKAESVVQAFAGGLGLISPKAAEVARGVGDAAGAMEGLGRLGGSFIGIAGPVGIAVAGLGLAYKVLAGQVEEAEQRMAAARAEAERAVALHRQVSTIAVRASIARGELSPEEGKLQLASAQAEDTFRVDQDQAREKLQEVAKAAAAARGELANLQQQNAKGIASTADLQRIDQLKEALSDKLNPAVAAAEETVHTLNVAEAELATNLFDIATNAHAGAAGLERQAEAVEKLGKSLADLLELDDQAKALGGIEYLIERAELAAAMQAAGAAAPTIQGGMSGTDAALAAQAFNQNLAAGASGSLPVPPGASPGGRLANGLGAAASLTNSLGAGDVGSLVNTQMGMLQALGPGLGPAGMAVSAGVELASALQSIGALEVRDPETGEIIKSSAEVVGERLDSWFENTIKGLEAMPEILGEKLPGALEKGAPALIDALIENAPEIGIGLLKALAAEYKALILDIPVAMVAGFIDALEAWWDNAMAFFRDLASGGLLDEDGVDWERVGVVSARVALGVATLGASEIVGRGLEASGRDVPLFHSGGLNDRERVAVLLQGERVYQEGEPASSMARSSGAGGGEVHIHLHGPVMGPQSLDWVREEMDKMFGADGPGLARWRPLGSS